MDLIRAYFVSCGRLRKNIFSLTKTNSKFFWSRTVVQSATSSHLLFYAWFQLHCHHSSNEVHEVFSSIRTYGTALPCCYSVMSIMIKAHPQLPRHYCKLVNSTLTPKIIHIKHLHCEFGALPMLLTFSPYDPPFTFTFPYLVSHTHKLETSKFSP